MRFNRQWGETEFNLRGIAYDVKYSKIVGE